MVDGEAIAYSILNTALGSQYLITTDANQTPAKYPCITVEEVDNYTPKQYMDGSNNDNYSSVAIDINIYTKAKVNGGGKKQEARAIFLQVDQAMLHMGFRRTMTSPVTFADNTTYRLAIRYNALISNDETIYRR